MLCCKIDLYNFVLPVQRSETGRIIPYSFSKIRQEQEERSRDVDLGFSSPALINKSTTSVIEDDDLEDDFKYEDDLDLLTTVLAEVDIGHSTLKPCDIDSNVGQNDLNQDKSPASPSLLSEQPPLRMVSSLSETPGNNIYKVKDDLKSAKLEKSATEKPLSETFCDEIFDELEKTSTFPDWTLSRNSNPSEILHSDSQEDLSR